MRLKTSMEMVVGHWSQTIVDLHISPFEFYAKVRAAVEAMDIPSAKVSRVWWRESRLISARREYLRVERSRIVFDICCAPFAKGSFVSMWLCIVPFCLSLTHICGMFMIGLIAGTIISQPLGDYMAHSSMGLGHSIFVFPTLCFGIAAFVIGLLHIPLWWLISERMESYVFINNSVISDLISGMTIFAPILLVWADRRPTYYRIDSALVFQSAIHQTTFDILDGYFSDQNIRPLTELERKPVMREFLRKK